MPIALRLLNVQISLPTLYGNVSLTPCRSAPRELPRRSRSSGRAVASMANCSSAALRAPAGSVPKRQRDPRGHLHRREQLIQPLEGCLSMDAAPHQRMCRAHAGQCAAPLPPQSSPHAAPFGLPPRTPRLAGVRCAESTRHSWSTRIPSSSSARLAHGSQDCCHDHRNQWHSGIPRYRSFTAQWKSTVMWLHLHRLPFRA